MTTREQVAEMLARYSDRAEDWPPLPDDAAALLRATGFQRDLREAS